MQCHTWPMLFFLHQQNTTHNTTHNTNHNTKHNTQHIRHTKGAQHTKPAIKLAIILESLFNGNSRQIARVGQNHTYISIYGVYTLVLAGELPYIRSNTVYIYSSGQPYKSPIYHSCIRLGLMPYNLQRVYEAFKYWFH